jgi:phosphate transport system substrate-binding protein
MYTNGEPTGLTKEFLDYMLSEDVQGNLIEALGYIPSTQMKVDRDLEGNVTPIE